MRVLTGVKPTEIPHLGNYLGAMRPAIELAKKADQSLLFIADYHALNSIHDGKKLREYTYDVTATWIACGMDSKKTIVYRQSDVPELFELTWMLSNHTPKGFMNRAHAYKAQIQANEEAGKKDLDAGVSMALYSYPILMSADILLFSADVVPVGEDQLQHLEFARDIAQKFNNAYGDLLKLPKAEIQKQALIPGLDGRKMSKSYGNHIPLFLPEKKLRKLVMKIVTDSTPPEDPKDPETSNIFQLYKFFASKEQQQDLRSRYEKGIGWGEAKQSLFEVIDFHFASARDLFNELRENTEELDKILESGAEKAREIAIPFMKELRKAVRDL